VNNSLPTRKLRDNPDLDQLKRQAKELLDAFRSGDENATVEINAHYRGADSSSFALHDAQLVIARAYGFESWTKLKAFVAGVTSVRFRETVQAGDLASVRAMLAARSELAHVGLHQAVVDRSVELVRLLMDAGANARSGIYPHRDATSALIIARERGYDEIVEVILQAEQKRRNPRTGMEDTPSLHHAAQTLDSAQVKSLLDQGADASTRDIRDRTPLDLAAQHSSYESAAEFGRIATMLLERGAILTAHAAAALGDADWLRARHDEDRLTNPIENTGGLLRIAASHNRPDILALLLDFGFDPDERIRFVEVGPDDVVFTWGMPLYHCAGAGKHEMAEMLLKRGADPNASVYASGDPVFQAYSQRDWRMVELLARYGGVPEASTAGLYRQTELARKMLAGEASYRTEGAGGQTLGQQLLWGAACGGDPAIVRMALETIDWARDDPRWFNLLEQPLRIWSHGQIDEEWDRATYLECFRLILQRSDPNIRGRLNENFGLTILHSVAGSREHVTQSERVAFATMLLDAGARLDIRDNLLKSTPLGWACRWGRVELIKLLLERGADPRELDADPWARPAAWAKKMGREDVLAILNAT
jgi:ankyrin repeat protein